MSNSLRHLISSRPILDHIVPVVLTALWWFAFSSWTPEDEAARQWVYATTATVAGLVLAASTFACTMTYQASDSLMVKVRKKNSRTLRRNWFAILQSSLASAALPLFCLAIDDTCTKLSIGIVIYVISLLLLRFRRALSMLALVLFVSENSARLENAKPSELVIPKTRRVDD